MLKVYENKQFIILGGTGNDKSAYILYNKHKDFKDGHTHLNNYNTAMWLMKLFSSRKLPHDLGSLYLLQSLKRISDDDNYTRKVQELIDSKSNKSRKYYINVQKGVKQKRRKRK